MRDLNHLRLVQQSVPPCRARGSQRRAGAGGEVEVGEGMLCDGQQVADDERFGIGW